MQMQSSVQMSVELSRQVGASSSRSSRDAHFMNWHPLADLQGCTDTIITCQNIFVLGSRGQTLPGMPCCSYQFTIT